VKPLESVLNFVLFLLRAIAYKLFFLNEGFSLGNFTEQLGTICCKFRVFTED
jgi:hypothetical protein